MTLSKTSISGVMMVLLLQATPSFAQWRVGQEREVDEGYYLKLTDSFQGWRIWRTETRNGVRCQAIKSAIGLPHPEPVGVQDMFYRGTPYLRVSRGYRAPFGLDLRGRWGWGGKWRVVGERFWNDELAWDDLEDGTRIEIHLETWEYDAVKVGLERERGVIDLAGLDDVISKLANCDENISIPGLAEPGGPTPQGGLPTAAYYPSRALREELQGVVGYLLEVSEYGRVTNCKVTQSSGHEVLDTATCRQLRRYQRFNPATDENGQTVVGYYEGTIRYRLNS